MDIRVIPTRVHGAVDYAVPPVLAAAPNVLRLDGGRASALAPRIVGASTAVYGALTDYELGVRRLIPMRVHLLLDAVGGSALAAAPWLFGSARRGVRHWLPHAVVGATEVVLAVTTKTRPRPTAAQRVLASARRAPALLRTRRAAAIALPVAGAGVVAYAARRRLFGAAAAAAGVVEEATDAIEEAADEIEGVGDAVESAGDHLKEAAQARAAETAGGEDAGS